GSAVHVCGGWHEQEDLDPEAQRSEGPRLIRARGQAGRAVRDDSLPGRRFKRKYLRRGNAQRKPDPALPVYRRTRGVCTFEVVIRADPGLTFRLACRVAALVGTEGGVSVSVDA